MGVLVDYSCPRCLGRHEVRLPSPPPATDRCPACGGDAVRSWSPIGITRSTMPTPAAGPEPSRPAPLCATNPDVPGLCHMSPDARRMWVARARKDGRAVERELQRQERAVAAGTAPMGPPLSSHRHHHNHDHDHG